MCERYACVNVHVCVRLCVCFPSVCVSHVCLCMHKSLRMVYLFAGIYVCTCVCTWRPSRSNTQHECRPTNVYVCIIDDAVYLYLCEYTHTHIYKAVLCLTLLSNNLVSLLVWQFSTKLTRTRNSCLFIRYFNNTYGKSQFLPYLSVRAIFRAVTQTIN